MIKNHPMVETMMLTGEPPNSPRPLYEDYFGRLVYEGDAVLIIDGEHVLKEPLSLETVEILKEFGLAEEIIVE